VISLGIQTCQDLVFYCEKWKFFDDDVAHLQIQIDELRKTLKNLDHILQKFKNSNVAILKNVKRKIVSANDDIRKLKAVLDKCHSSESANSVQRKVNKLWKHAFYSFKKIILQELKFNVTNLQYNLNTSLHTLGL
jgi:thymidine kinase